jgi:hypothetical protein
VFFVLTDALYVFRSVESAILNIEPIEAEDDFQVAFDEAGVPYRVHWFERNSRNRWWIFETVGMGSYELVPDGPPDPASLLTLLDSREPEWMPGEFERPELDAALAALRFDIGETR